MNDPLDEIVKARDDLKDVQKGLIWSFEYYQTPAQGDLWKLSRVLDRLDKAVVWIEKNTPEVRPCS